MTSMSSQDQLNIKVITELLLNVFRFNDGMTVTFSRKNTYLSFRDTYT
jgi:hypothetical protein